MFVYHSDIYEPLYEMLDFLGTGYKRYGVADVEKIGDEEVVLVEGLEQLPTLNHANVVAMDLKRRGYKVVVFAYSPWLLLGIRQRSK